jgi:DNA replication protein DnaC
MKMKHEDLVLALKQLRLNRMVHEYVEVAKMAEKEKMTYEQYLSKLIQVELESKRQNRIKKLIWDSKIPYSKNIEAYDFSIRTGLTQLQFNRLAEGEFIKQGGNVVFYGSFGVGKTHLAIQLLQKMCELGYRCIYYSTHTLINQLLAAKRDLEINSLFKRLDRYDLIVCDELGYIPHTQEGADLFFQLISQRAERKSLLITTNLTYSEWDKVFLNSLTTAAAVDRIIHNCQTFNIGGQSYRSITAKKRSTELTTDQEKTIQ